MNIHDEDKEKLKIDVGSIPHPIFNSILGNNIPYRENIFQNNGNYSKYLINIVDKKLNVKLRMPEVITTKSRENLVETKDINHIRLSLEDIIEEQGNITDKEYMYTVDLGDETKTYTGIEHNPNEMAFYKNSGNNQLDFIEYQYRIPLFINKRDTNIFKNGIPKNNEGVKLFGIDIEFDTVFPEALIKKLQEMENTYIFTPSFTWLHKGKKVLGEQQINPTIDGRSWFPDRANNVSNNYSLINGLSGRHCKYEMTAARSPIRDKTIIHNDMIYDSLCNSNLNFHRMMSFRELTMKYIGKANANQRYDPVLYSGYMSEDGIGISHQIYPLPLNVQFDFTFSSENNNLNDDVLSNNLYCKIGDIVIRTYKGVNHFIPPNCKKLSDPSKEKDNYGSILNGDLYVDYLRSFTFKISIPRNTPSLVIKHGGQTHYLETYSIPTSWQMSSEKIDIADFSSHSPEHILNSIRPNNFVTAKYIEHVGTLSDSGSFMTYKAFINHIKELGGFNGFLLPSERRCCDWPSEKSGNYENFSFVQLESDYTT